MTEKSANTALLLAMTILLFSLWAGFALLVVNPYFHKDLPGYTIGRICIWEGVALLVAGVLAWFIHKKWGGVKIQQDGKEKRINLNINYAWFFSAHLCLSIIVGIWQFWLFSQGF